MPDHFLDSKLFEKLKSIEKDNSFPQEFNIPPGQSIMIPSAIVYQAQRSYATSSYPNPISVELPLIIEDSSSEEDRAWATKAPYRLLASNERIYIYTTSLKDPQHPHADLQIMRLDYDPTTGQVKKIFRDCVPSTFRLAVAQFPRNTVVGKVSEVLAIEKPSVQDIQKYEEVIAESKRVERIRDELIELSRRDFFTGQLKETSQNTSSIHKVDQGEYSVAKASQKEWLATHGASPCYIVSIYDRKQKQGALAHIDASVDGEATFDLMAHSLSVTKKNEGDVLQYQVTISGGDQSSVADGIRVYDKIKNWQQNFGKSIEVKVGTVFRGSGESLALNLNTGELQQFICSPTLAKIDKGIVMSTTFRAIASAYEGKKPARFSPPE